MGLGVVIVGVVIVGVGGSLLFVGYVCMDRVP